MNNHFNTQTSFKYLFLSVHSDKIPDAIILFISHSETKLYVYFKTPVHLILQIVSTKKAQLWPETIYTVMNIRHTTVALSLSPFISPSLSIYMSLRLLW